jgi:UDP-glucose 4-epimerase
LALYVVTGGAGFIGSHLVEALIARGDRVRVLDDLSTGRRDNLPAAPGTELIVGDVADRALAGRVMAGADGCFHLAAIASVQRSNEDWCGTHRANLSGTIAMLDAARDARDGGPVPVVYASSAAIYGDNPSLPLAETATPRPLTAYGADKLGSEQHARVGWLVHRVPSTGFRFFNVYGPRQDPKSPYSGVIAIFADRVAADRTITIFGDGGQTRDFVYVGDVVRHLLAAMDRPAPDARVFNVCTGRVTTVLDLARIIAEIADRPSRVEHAAPRAGDIRESLGDPAAAAAAFGFTADVPVAQGLRHTLAALARPA